MAGRTEARVLWFIRLPYIHLNIPGSGLAYSEIEAESSLTETRALPDGVEEHTNADGNVVFIDHNTRETGQKHPGTGLPVLPKNPPPQKDSTGEEWFIAIMNNDLESVKGWIDSNPNILRRVLTSTGKWTPMHAASYFNKVEILKLMLEADLNKITIWEYFSRWLWKTSAYNTRTTVQDWSPIFYATSKEIIELMLQFRENLHEQFVGKFHDLHLTYGQGVTLLWECAGRGVMSENILFHLKDQLCTRVNGILPLENALQNGNTDSCILIIETLHSCPLEMISQNVKVLMSNTSTYFCMLEKILKVKGLIVSQWLHNLAGELSQNITFPCLVSMTMKAMGETGWFDQNDNLHKKLLWQFCSEGNLTMVKYMLTLPGIMDEKLADGTTAFVMALAGENIELIRILLYSPHKNDIDPEMLIVNAIKDLDKEAEYPNLWLRTNLASVLQEQGVPLETTTALHGILNDFYFECLREYPILNPSSEGLYPYNKQLDDKMKTVSKLGKGCRVEKMKQYIVTDICMENIPESLPKVKKCCHKGNEQMHCNVIHDILKMASLLQEYLCQGPLKDYGPKFELVGSMAEGTRIGVPNELDLGFSFQYLKQMENIPFKVEDDPFSLKKTVTTPDMMMNYFCGRAFKFHKFMKFLLESVEDALSRIFEEGKNSFRLKCVTTNQQWRDRTTRCDGQCKNNANFEQCTKCMVAISQTKSGIALQFEWVGGVYRDDKIYCSIDLIPIFPIEPIPALQLAKLINTAMLSSNPPKGWLRFLHKYTTEYMIIQELAEPGAPVLSVGLKTMNYLRERNHHVKPAQAFTEAEYENKFRSKRMKDMYCYIKFLKKVAHIEINSFWTKKELLKQKYSEILEDCNDDDRALVMILSQPEIKTKVENAIDLEKSNYLGFVNLK